MIWKPAFVFIKSVFEETQEIVDRMAVSKTQPEISEHVGLVIKSHLRMVRLPAWFIRVISFLFSLLVVVPNHDGRVKIDS